MYKTLLFSSYVLLFVVHSALAQKSYPENKKIFPFGVIEEIDSEELSEKRILNIYLPQGYHPDSVTTYPVVYVLDGSAHEDFPHIAGLVQFLNMYELMPKSIVVGIANVDRYRDFTHPSDDPEDLKALPTGGGSEKFIGFLEKEVQDLVTQHYKTNGHRTLIGQSLGGLLATEIFLKKPQLFDDYIIVSPSLWWDQQSLVDTAASVLKANTSLKKKVFLSLGKEHEVMHEVADKLAHAIKNTGNSNITFFYESLLDENHATILHRAVYRAFECLYPAVKEK
ncbi:alpha/beta hydrolase-fold protein [Rapidithrix thailandica]|uniref:Alpha/beta hydrolase-fold protein n=1 Tax=Rapidithrix thailandica TaxID=413964 RepID=A0AAW9SDA2_9BACT